MEKLTMDILDILVSQNQEALDNNMKVIVKITRNQILELASDKKFPLRLAATVNATLEGALNKVMIKGITLHVVDYNGIKEIDLTK